MKDTEGDWETGLELWEASIGQDLCQAFGMAWECENDGNEGQICDALIEGKRNKGLIADIRCCRTKFPPQHHVILA